MPFRQGVINLHAHNAVIRRSSQTMCPQAHQGFQLMGKISGEMERESAQQSARMGDIGSGICVVHVEAERYEESRKVVFMKKGSEKGE